MGARFRPDRPDLRDRDLKIRKHLQKKRFELFVGPVDLVDQKNHGLPGVRLDGFEERAADEKLLAKNLLADLLAGGGADFGLLHPEDLFGIIPLVQRRGRIQPLVALEADQAGVEDLGQDFGDLRLADPRLPFHQNGFAQFQGEIKDRRRIPVDDILGPSMAVWISSMDLNISFFFLLCFLRINLHINKKSRKHLGWGPGPWNPTRAERSACTLGHKHLRVMI